MGQVLPCLFIIHSAYFSNTHRYIILKYKLSYDCIFRSESRHENLNILKRLHLQILALEVLGRLASHPHLVEFICHHFDLTSQSTKVFTDFVNAVSNFIRSSLLSHPADSAPSSVPGLAGQVSGPISRSDTGPGGMPGGGPGLGGPRGGLGGAGFACRGHFVPLMMNIKMQFVDMLEKTGPEAPPLAEGYALSVAFLTLLDLVRSVQVIVDGTGKQMSSSCPPRLSFDIMLLNCTSRVL